MNSEKRLEQIVGMLVLLLLVIGCFVVLRPFLSALLWSLILSFSTWPIYSWCERVLDGRKTLAAVLMTLLVAAVLLMPLIILGSSLADDVARATAMVRVILSEGPPDPPRWIADMPIAGPYAYEYWLSLTHNSAKLAADLGKYLVPTGQWVLNMAAILGEGTLQLALSVLISFFFYRDGIHGAKRLNALAERLGGERALQLLAVAGATIKSVVYGIIGTAIVQAILAGIGFWLAGVPGVLLLGFLTFFLSLLPMGPPLVWIPAAIWLFYTDGIGWAIFLALWGLLVVSSADNFIKPYFISRGSDLPFILVFLGVLGGAIAFGLLGVFLGPTLLAVGYNIVRNWTSVDLPPSSSSPESPSPR